MPSGFFGVNAQLLQPLPTTGRVAELDRHLDSLAELGVDFARANLDWRIIEPLPPTAAGHAYDFTTTDAWVEALARHRVRWQLTGQGVPTPDWARDPSADADPADPESWYGVADPVSGAPYPTAEAYREQIEAIAAGTPVPEIGANPCAAPEG